jgi:hypothetical protein
MRDFSLTEEWLSKFIKDTNQEIILLYGKITDLEKKVEHFASKK